VRKYRNPLKRNVVRDLSALYFSVLDTNISQTDVLRFISAYFGLPVKTCRQQYKKIFSEIVNRTKKLYERVHYRSVECSKPLLMGTAKHLPLACQYFESIFQLSDNVIATSTLNDMIRYSTNDKTYYIKRYYGGGKGLRRYCGRSRLRGEYDNSQYFRQMGIETPNIVLFVEKKRFMKFKKGVMITEGIDNVIDLKTLKLTQPERFQNREWRMKLLMGLAEMSSRLHHQRFIHEDLKWRNILVDPNHSERIIWIDCPLGSRRFGHWFHRGRIKDLMSLDKEANNFLSRTDRLRFYLKYQAKLKLDTKDKQLIRAIHHAYR